MVDFGYPQARFAVLAASLSAAGCTTSAPPLSSDASIATYDRASVMATSSAASARIAALRARFARAGNGAALGSSCASELHRDSGRILAVVSPEASRTVLRAATTELPATAMGRVELRDAITPVRASFSLPYASAVEALTADGMLLYPFAVEGGDLIRRVLPDGVEDFVAFERAPDREELSYEIEMSATAGLRLVTNTLELLDASGTPRFRVAPPWLIDANGIEHEATLSIEGCLYDTSVAAPWRRPVTPAGASACTLKVKWTASAYPVLVDPKWTTTGSMAYTRSGHTATMLPSGEVLLAGGFYGTGNTIAELFDGTGSFASAGKMTTGRWGHTATLLKSGKVLIAGGNNGADTSTAELYDATSGFSATGSMTDPRDGHTATMLADGTVLIAGGIRSGAILSGAEIFDGTSTFTPTAFMNLRRVGHSATLLPTGKVLIVAGDSASGVVSSAELFDGSGPIFLPTGALAAPRNAPVAVALGSGKVLIVGGSDGSAAGLPMSTAEIFDGVSTFSAAGTMTFARANHSVTTLADGTLLVAGGTSGLGAVLSASELYSAGSFAVSAIMKAARQGHTATLLKSGSVLAAGGSGAGGAELSSAELFTPDTTTTDSGVPDSDATDATPVDSGAIDTGASDSTTIDTGASDSAATDAVASDSAATTEAAPNTDSASSIDTGTPVISGPYKSCKTSADCGGGPCVEGVCCDSPCTGTCESCALPASPGVCTPVPYGQDPKASCGASGTCVGTCNGKGACVAGAAGSQCVASACTGPSTGHGPAYCSASASCDTSHESTFDCSPFACDPVFGACKSGCLTSADCTSGATCGSDGRCASTTSAPSSGGGCGCSTVGHSATRDLWAALLVGAAFLARRRRENSRAGA